MAVKKIILLWVAIAIVGVGIFAFVWRKPTPNPMARLEAEREVLAVLLANLSYSEVKVFSIAEFTTLGRFEESNSIEDFPSTFAGLRGVKRETLFNFQENNKQAYPIQEYLPTSVETTIINNAGYGQTWWIAFSRVGFSSSLTEAVVLIEEHLDCLEGNCSYGTGNFVFLKKIDNKWTIQDRFMYWRSHPT
jgi:hypothetical protein